MDTVMDESMELLKKWVFDDGKIITAGYMIRNTPLNVMQTQHLLNKFVKANGELCATYYLIGEKDDQPNGHKQCLIVKKEEVERIKQQFMKVTLCTVNSVYKTPVKNLELFNADWQEKEAMSMRDLKGKTFIKSTKAEKWYEDWELSAKCENANPEEIELLKSPCNLKQEQRSPEKAEYVAVPSKNQRVEKPVAKSDTKKSSKEAGTQMKISNFFNSK